MSKIWIAAAFVVLGASPALAQPYAASGVDIVDAAARLTVVAEDRADISVDITPSARVPAPSVRMVDARVVIDGERRISGCRSGLGFIGRTQRTSVQVDGLGWVNLEDLPAITLRVPARLDLTADGAVFSDIGRSAGGKLRLQGCGDGHMGAASGALDVALVGSGSLHADAVGGALVAHLTGSGDLTIAGARTAELHLNGSGELSVGNVAGAAAAELNGSGELDLGAAGETRLALRGSGEIVAGAVTGALSATLDGSGDVTVASVSGGDVSLALVGSGDLTVRGGSTPHLAARLAGSGDVDFGGDAQEVVADLNGSGDITIARTATAPVVHKRGSGDVHIGGAEWATRGTK